MCNQTARIARSPCHRRSLHRSIRARIADLFRTAQLLSLNDVVNFSGSPLHKTFELAAMFGLECLWLLPASWCVGSIAKTRMLYIFDG